jgi:hypothetical protein
VLGNLLGIAKYDLHGYLECCRKQHGKLFKVGLGEPKYAMSGLLTT